MNDQTALTPYGQNLPAATDIIEGYVTVSPGQKPRPPIEQLITDWVARKQSPKTRASYAATAHDFVLFLREYRDEQGTQIDALESYRQDIAKAVQVFIVTRKDPTRAQRGLPIFHVPEQVSHQVTVATRNQRLAALRSFYTDLVEDDYLPKNPLTRLKAIKGDKPHQAHALALEEIEAALTAMPAGTLKEKRDKAMLSFMAILGSRVSEVTGLTWDRLYYEGRKMVARFVGKGGKLLIAELTPGLKGLLESYQEALVLYLEKRGQKLAPDMPVFINLSKNPSRKAAQGNPLMIPLSIEAVSTITERWLKDGRNHIWRHSRAVNAVQLGASYKDIQEDYGHTTLAVTTIYLDEHIRKEKPYQSALERAYGIKPKGKE